MLVSPTSFSMPSPGPIDEFLNLDPQDPIDFLTFSRNSSSSPASSVNPLPPTPLQHQSSSVGTSAADTVDITGNEIFQDFYRDFILQKSNLSNPNPILTDNHASTSTADQLPSSSVSLPFSFGDLFAGYGISNPADSLFAPLGGMSSYPLAIDPQLMATQAVPSLNLPTPAPVLPTFKAPTPPSTNFLNTPSLRDMGSDTEDDSDEEDEPQPKARVSTRGGKKASAVATGGIVKRTGPTSCVVRDPESNDPDDWRPTAEEYKKLSSKEKRQLRNKISARNFRVRRKEYITTLEGHIADRDRLIEAIREELGQSKLENSELRQEVDALKKAMLEGKAHPTGLPPPAPISDAVASATPAPLSSKRRPNINSTPLAKPNINKDVSGSATANSKSFWGGASVGTGGITPVHAALIPDMHFPSATASVLSGKSLGSRTGNGLQDNINPLLNMFPPSPPASPPTNTTNSPPIANNTLDALLRNAAASHWVHPQQHSQVFDAFSDNNPFTIKTLDGYRMQLWGKVAAAQHLAQQQQHLQQLSPPTSSSSSSSASSSPSPQNMFMPLPLFNQASNLSSSLRPAFFKSSTTSPTLSATLAGKASGSYSPLRPSTPSQSSHASTSSVSQQQKEAQATAYVAAMASQSLVSRMGTAFWDAFSGNTSSPSGNKNWDADKVRKVLEGKAVVRVVDVDDIRESTPKVKVSKFVSTATSPKLLPTLGLATPKLGPSRPGVDSLEDCMKKMTLKEESSFSLGASADSEKCAAMCAGVFTNLRGVKSPATEAK